MRWLRIAVTAFLFAARGTVAAAPAAVGAVDKAPPVLKGITVSPDAVSVAGLDLVPVTVTAHLTDESGVEAASRVRVRPVAAGEGDKWLAQAPG